MTETAQDKKISAAGVVLTVVATLGFVWAAVQWYNRYDWPRELSIDEIKSNEVRTFDNVKLIVQAQAKYRERDWDDDGKKTYAGFLVHLWTSVNTQSDPILVELIGKELGFAMGPAESIDGYYFEDIRRRGLPAIGRQRELDYSKEWAVVGVPVAGRKTGFLIFLADESGRIFARDKRGVPQRYPHDPLADGWTEIGTVEHLKNLQNTIKYAQE